MMTHGSARSPFRLSPGAWVLGAVVAWKVVLLAGFGLPVPANDAFFYDGAVISALQGGAYVNATVVDAFPISGGQVFSAYPPLYQAVLWGWLRVFGVGVEQTQWLHLGLFAGFALAVGVLFRLWRVSALAGALGGMFLFGITFHERPDSLAHVLGAWSLVSWSLGAQRSERTVGWAWVSALAVVLTLATSVQIGALYLAIHYALGGWGAWRGGARPVWAALVAMLVVPVIAVAVVIRVEPLWWAGFREHVRLTPSHTGWRLPSGLELIKAVRTGPAVLFLAVWWGWRVGPRRGWFGETSTSVRLGAVVLLASVGVLGVAMVLFSANLVAIVGYLQVLVVGLGVDGVLASVRGEAGRRRWLLAVLAGLVVLTSVRAIGLSTVGVTAARVLGRAQAQGLVRVAYARQPATGVAVVSSVFLYDLSGRPGARLVFADWAPALESQRPGLLVLTAFDYHRGFAETIAGLERDGRVRAIVAMEDGGRPAPDRSRFWGRVWSHLTWQPVIVELDWAELDVSVE